MAAMLAASLATSAAEAGPSKDDYARAARVLDNNLGPKILNAKLQVHWLENGKSLWYQRRTTGGAVQYMTVDTTTGRRTVSDKAPTSPPASTTPAYESLSPGGAWAVSARDNNLWVRDVKASAERQVTTDGSEHFSYGKVPDSSLQAVTLMRAKTRIPPVGVTWSPDGSRLFGTRSDEREIEPYPFVEWVPQDGSFRPITWNLRLTLMGDKGRAKSDGFIIDVATGAKRSFAAPKGYDFYDNAIAWSADGTKAYGIGTSEDTRAGALFETDLVTGAVRTVISDREQTPFQFNVFIYSTPNVRILGGGKEALWFSQRDGWGHLYLYDVKTGKLKRRLTQGSWVVWDVVAVDEAKRRVFFTAAGREPGRDPYYRNLYSVSLDGGVPKLLTPENVEHEISAPPSPAIAALLGATAGQPMVAPNGKVFIDMASTLTKPPVTTLRSTDDGRVIATLETADTSQVEASGYRPPERFTAKAADGVTDVWGVIFLPPGYDSKKRYPVINALYGGPQVLAAPRGYYEAVYAGNPVSRASLAELGFIVVTVDGRGTPGRSKAFQNVSYGNFADPAIADHAAVLKQLAKRYPGMDMDRVGVFGHSFGGYVSARSMLKEPDLYKAGVSSAGPHDWENFYIGMDPFLGEPDYGNGVRTRPTANARPANYADKDNGVLADKLKGRLLLIYGDMDENALPASTLQFIDALTKANKRYDLIYLPNRTHSFFRTDPYYVQRMWDYFVEHLQGAEPPADFRLTFDPWPGR